MNTILLSLIIIVAVLLILIIMVQNPKGGGISATFGGGGSSSGGVQNTNTFLDKSTWMLSAVMVGLVLIVNLTNPDRKRKVSNDTNLENTLDNRVIDETPTEAPATPLEGKKEGE